MKRETFDVMIEIPKGSRNKYEYDPEIKAIRFDRMLFSPVHYPADYGFILNTLAMDGDPLDALVMVWESTFPGCVIEAFPIGLFMMRDEKGEDEKVLCVPRKDPLWNHVKNLEDIPSKALSLEEILEIRSMFLEASIRAHKAGFDGIELHGAHGFLLSQFASPKTNKRTDKYGGSLLNNIRLPLEIVGDLNQHFQDRNFIIAYRMGGNEPSLKDGIRIAKELEIAGVNLLHVSAGIEDPELGLPVPPKKFPFSWIVYMGTEIKKNVSIPVIVVNGIRTSKEAALIIENRLADFVAIGRGQLVDWDWTKKALHQLDVNPCLECEPRCHWYESGDLCPQNQALGI